jgi:uncharacterized SAM-binding protein YcdF (DUF218 family)
LCLIVDPGFSAKAETLGYAGYLAETVIAAAAFRLWRRCGLKPPRLACYAHAVKILQRSLLLLVVITFTFGLIVYGSYFTLPTDDTSATHFDTIVVLGTPARPDGAPSPEQRERVLEGIREYRAGIAPHLIMTGGPAHNQFVEAHVMAQFAESQGVPASDILEEGQAQSTIQNIYYSAQIMHRQGWSSAEVVSSPYHLGRTALILNTFDLRQPELAVHWRTHPAAWPPEYSFVLKTALYSVEAWRCFDLRVHGFPASRFLPRP